jgi:hypothetical protein
MFIFGHMGFGAAMARPWANPFRKLSFGMILLGTVLPDLIDKTLYYSLSFWTCARADLRNPDFWPHSSFFHDDCGIRRDFQKSLARLARGRDFHSSLSRYDSRNDLFRELQDHDLALALAVCDPDLSFVSVYRDRRAL